MREAADFCNWTKTPCVLLRRTSCCSPAVNLSTWCTSRRQNSTGWCPFVALGKFPVRLSVRARHRLSLYCFVSPFPVCLRFLKKKKNSFLTPLSCFSTSPLSSFLRPPLLHFVYLSETNLKVRQSLTVTGELGDNIEKLADFDGKISLFNSAVLRLRATHTHTHAFLHNNQELHCVQFPAHRSKTAAGRKSTLAKDALSVTVLSKFHLFFYFTHPGFNIPIDFS